MRKPEIIATELQKNNYTSVWSSRGNRRLDTVRDKRGNHLEIAFMCSTLIGLQMHKHDHNSSGTYLLGY